MAPVGAPAHQSWSRRPLSSDSGAGVFRFAAVDALRSGAGAAAAALAAFYLLRVHAYIWRPCCYPMQRYYEKNLDLWPPSAIIVEKTTTPYET
jgi:hypothetical protein